MNKSWAIFEKNVREAASSIFSCTFSAERIDGTNFDAYGRINDEVHVVVEITEERDLKKAREDCAKIVSTKLRLASEGIVLRSYIILRDEPTPGMVEVGRNNKIKVMSFSQFLSEVFDFSSYNFIRSAKAFGSAFNPETGRPDEMSYVSVSYKSDGGVKMSVMDISSRLLKGKNVVLLGDYGTGKSRCVKELYEGLSKKVGKEFIYPIAINLRDHWGAKSGIEILVGHFQRIGFSTNLDSVIRLLGSGRVVILLDGFDEVGSHTFGDKIEERSKIRREALSGVRDLISLNKGGVIVTGRPHYFESDQELMSSLGLSIRNDVAMILRCSDEFDLSEANEYLSNLGLTASTPSWLPKKPLMFQIIASLDPASAEEILASKNGEIGFWGQFIDSVCLREARMHGSIDPEWVREILRSLAVIVRLGEFPMGRLSPLDIASAYQKATGSVVDDAGNQMLSRLCTLGRIEPESPDRQFVDPYIVQLLFAEGVVSDIEMGQYNLLERRYRQPLDSMGVLFLAQWIEVYSCENESLSFILRSSGSENQQVVSEVISALIKIPGRPLSFSGLEVCLAEIAELDFGVREFSDVSFESCIINELFFKDLKIKESDNVRFANCEVLQVNGLTSSSALPLWVESSCSIGNFQSLPNSKRIKESQLAASQKLFLSVVQKIFFQRGGGRKENSLYKGGFGEAFDRRLIDKILSILVLKGIVQKSKDSSSFIYNPNREYTPRMKAIRDQLSLSQDPIWLEIRELK